MITIQILKRRVEVKKIMGKRIETALICILLVTFCITVVFPVGTDKAREYSEKNNLELIVHNRYVNPLKHNKFLKILAQHEYYIDVKKELVKGKIQTLRALSLTGLEALAIGCKVIDWKGDIHEKFPTNHRLKNICANLMKIYNELLNH